MLFVTSFDCYCSVITFSEGELGSPLPEDKLPPNLLPSQSEKKQQADSLKMTPKRKATGKDGKKVSEVELKGTPSPSKVETVTDPRQSSGKTPRRIRPTQLSSFPSPGGTQKSETVTTPTSPTTTTNTKAPPPDLSSAPPTTKTLPTISSGAPPTTTETVAKTVGNSGSKTEGPRRVNFITLAKFDTNKEQGQSTSSTSSSQTSLNDSKTAGEPMETTE